MSNILTFGSCLSRYIARSYKRLYSGEIISSVYHNRSDYFVESFITNVQKPVDNSTISELALNHSNADEDSINILENQTLARCGMHKVDTVENIFSLIEKNLYDIIFIDNFMDIAAKLSHCGDEKVFLRPQDYTNYSLKYKIGDYISTTKSVESFNLIIDYFKKRNPKAKIFFFHFPWNTYENDEQRKKRSLSFFNEFIRDDIFIIPPQNAPKIYRTGVSSHFEEPQYTAYAGMVHALINYK